MIYLAQYFDKDARLRADEIIADCWKAAERKAFFDDRAPVVVGVKTG